MKSHEDLEVWKMSVELAAHVYTLTKKFPEDEKFGLVAQMRRAAVSIASNIAEGAGRRSNKEFAQFLYIAAGSASELNTQVVISSRISICSLEELANLKAAVERVSRMLQGLIRSIKEKDNARN
jgi:four helix bundle protein